MKCQQKWTIFKWVSYISVEPLFYLHMTAMTISNILGQDLFLYKYCKYGFNYSEEICTNLSAYNEIEDEVYEKTSTLNMYRDIIEHTFPVLFSLFLGNWSDKYGRKIPMMIGIAANFVQSFGLLINAIFIEWKPELVLLLSAFPYSLLGGYLPFLSSLYAHISDHSGLSSRFVKMTLLSATRSLGVTTASYLGGWLQEIAGFEWVFFAAVILTILEFFYCLMLIQDSPRISGASEQNTQENPNKDEEKVQETVVSQKISGENDSNLIKEPVEEKSICQFKWWSFFDVNHVKQCFLTVFKKRPEHRRTIILVLIISMVFSTTSSQGENTVEYLFVRERFDWGAEEYGLLQGYMTLMSTIALIALSTLLKKLLKLRDPVIGIISATFGIVEKLVCAFSVDAWMYYLGATAACVRALVPSSVRTMLSVAATEQETGKVFAAVASIESFVPLYASVVYSTVFNASLGVFTGAFYVMSAAFEFCVFSCIVAVFFLSKTGRLFSTKTKNEAA